MLGESVSKIVHTHMYMNPLTGKSILPLAWKHHLSPQSYLLAWVCGGLRTKSFLKHLKRKKKKKKNPHGTIIPSYKERIFQQLGCKVYHEFKQLICNY